MRLVSCYIAVYAVLTILSMLFPSVTYAQERSFNDSVAVGDSLSPQELPKEYELLKEHSSKNKITKALFSFIVKEPGTINKQNINKGESSDYEHFQDKIIRNINITVLLPFGTNVLDPEEKSDKLKFLNQSHKLTQENSIKKILQFKAGNQLSPILLMDSEALLRNTQYINDARILVDSIPGVKDSVDVKVIVRDKWTFGVDIHNLSPSNTNVELFDGNILGSGSRAGVYLIYSDKYDRKFGYGASYSFENISNSNINLSSQYVDYIDSYDVSVSAVRELQPKLNWFGEISYDKRVNRPDIFVWDSIAPQRREEFSITLGRAFTLSQEHYIRRFVVSLRYKSKNNSFQSPIFKDHIKNILLPYRYTNNKMLLMQASLYQNAYRREYMIYNFGTTEDVAQGYNISAQLGYSFFDDIKNAAYSSLSVSYGTNRFFRGNLYVSSAISSFFNKENEFGGILKFDTKYFSPLFYVSGLQFRQFLTLNYIKLLQPDRYFGDNVYLGEYTSIKMNDWRNGEKGVQQFLLKSETDFFSRYQVLGFKVLFYNFFDLGWITPTGKLFASDNINYGFGGGIRLRNNFIIFNTINIKIGFYPKFNQNSFGSFFKVGSSTPQISPNFIPRLPEEILVD